MTGGKCRHLQALAGTWSLEVASRVGRRQPVKPCASHGLAGPIWCVIINYFSIHA